MERKARQQNVSRAAKVFRFSLSGLIVFCLALIGGSACMTYEITGKHSSKVSVGADPKDPSVSVHNGAWGQLIARDIKLERPVEYLSDEVLNPHTPETWVFKGMQPDAVKALLGRSGLTDAQIAAAFAPESFREVNAGTEIKPSLEFLLSLDSETRRRLYASLSGQDVNPYLEFPFVFPGDSIEAIYADTRLHPDDLRLLKQLVYQNGQAHQLVDFEALLWNIPTAQRRVATTRVLSRQSVVLARLVVKEDTNIDQVAGYWGHIPNVRFTDIRPLFESLKALPEGGSLNLMFLLPPFARERLYTFPLPPKPGDPLMDCHWSTFNFSNETPDNRFNDPNYVVQYIKDNYYQITQPTIYGDIVLLMNDQNQIKHSAVHIADDLVFTKNGSNHRQPWALMRASDLLVSYPADPPLRLVYFRRKVD